MDIKCKNKEYILDTKWLKVRRDWLIINNGDEIDYYIVEKLDVALILAVNEKNEIILVNEYKYPVNQKMTGIPGGTFVREKESPLEAAKRELQEETGCESDKWELLVKTYEYPTKDTHEVFIYLAKDCKQTSEQKLDKNEELTYMWIHFKNAINKVMLNEINHGCTAYALLKCATLHPELLDVV